tara:strand:+ start:653 stop:1003 length:351 start_codon:yes stop_codon:yes gene_type:complete
VIEMSWQDIIKNEGMEGRAFYIDRENAKSKVKSLPRMKRMLDKSLTELKMFVEEIGGESIDKMFDGPDGQELGSTTQLMEDFNEFKNKIENAYENALSFNTQVAEMSFNEAKYGRR